ncbi:hypothetical protein RB598_006463 [Gaeumannomyces tritici]
MAKAQVTQANNTNPTNHSCPGSIPSIPGLRIDGKDCRVFCRPAEWTDVLLFFVINHVAHAATTISRPGQSAASTIAMILQALTIPSVGVRLALMTILRGISKPRWGGIRSSSLQKAAGAGALFAVVKAGAGQSQRAGMPDGEPSGDVEMGVLLPEPPAGHVGGRDGPPRAKEAKNSKFSSKIHGVCELPEGYDLVMVQPDAEFEQGDEETIALSCHFNVAKSLVSILQLVFSVTALYQAQGSQLERFGYAAYGLSVTPYAWMTLLNLLATLACPEYDRIYIVGSQGLDDLEQRLEAAGSEAKKRFQVTGIISRLGPSADERLQAFHKEICEHREHREHRRRFLRLIPEPRLFAVTILVSAVPLIAIIGISRAQPGQSNDQKHLLVLLWLVYGTFSFIYTIDPVDQLEGRPILGKRRGNLLFKTTMSGFLLFSLTVASFPILATMILDFGVCRRM